MAWDPDHYLRFADHRARPGIELMSRIGHDGPGLIVDLGAGAGNLTALLGDRWPDAEVIGVDSSPAMLETARREHPDIGWIDADISRWAPDRPVDVIYSNAALHWLDHHQALFRRIRSWLAPGGVMAVQMPDNWRAPTHRIPAELLDSGSWPEAASNALLRDRVTDPVLYRRWVQPAAVDVWRTTYYQELSGPDPVWNWVTGSILRPVLAALDDTDASRFSDECRRRYDEAYPPDEDGGPVLLPFSRLFLVAAAV